MQPYFHRETIDLHGKNIKELFDINFGKDWRLFINLFHSKQMGKHWLNYQNVTEVEKTKFKCSNLAGVVRDAYYSCCVRIMKDYFEYGMHYVEEEIEKDKYRFMWKFQKNAPQEKVVSSELYEKLNVTKELPPTKDLIKNKTVKVIERENNFQQDENEAEELSRLNDELNKLEQGEFKELQDKKYEEGLNEEEEKRYKELNKERMRLLGLIHSKESYV